MKSSEIFSDERTAVKRVSSCDIDLIKDIARLYCEIWKEPPWNEYFWKADNVFQDISSHMKEPRAIILAAFYRNKLAGFSWGKCVGEKELETISSGADLGFIFSDNPRAYYISELAVDMRMRQRRIGSNLAAELIREARKEGFAIFCLRTDSDATAAQRVYSGLGFINLGISDGKYPERKYWLLK
ncbi:MAG: GNAT family N-acetyltransferase [Candidatus Moranbacteria bacterium]|jgi:ribosomal protein S18 acetylase RimI-like enzyme|nr:GNAT family N-acetyltransferase [Candidatus Moranbacteria bacterium]MDX9856008.1 GNAT family N-acetyltransferase [Candidatus Moranbacteria bacterium]